MSLFDGFFPQEAQAFHLRRIADQLERGRDAEVQNVSDASLENRVQELERDLGFVSLVLGSILATLETKGSVTRADVCSAMQELDAADPTRDEHLDIKVLRSWGRNDSAADE